MTEHEWLACADPELKVECLADKVSDRKFRLAGCAACRMYWDHLADGLRSAVQTAERFADGMASKKELKAVKDACLARGLAGVALDDFCDANHAFELVLSTLDKSGIFAVNCATSYWRRAEEIEHKWSILYDVIGPLPFRPIALEPDYLTWNDGTLVKMSEAIYKDRAFDRLPILADALEESGCTNEDVLAHLRGAGPHVRGCWVVDLLLGRE